MFVRRVLAAYALPGILFYVATFSGSVTPPTDFEPVPFAVAQAPTAKDGELRSTSQSTDLSASAIAALIVRESRDAYYATGHPCACPDDLMRNGRRCGGNSAYIRPRGAHPLCSVGDVTAEMISRYRTRLAH